MGLVCLVIGARCEAQAANPRDDGIPFDAVARLRPASALEADLIEEGLCRSATVRSLVATLKTSDLIVYVGGLRRASFPFRSRTDTQRHRPDQGAHRRRLSMTRHRRIIGALVAGLTASAWIGSPTLAGNSERRSANGTFWVANRGDHTIRGCDADTGSVVHDVALRPGSQPGDLAYAKGKLYVSEEFGTPPAIAIVDVDAGEIIHRIFLAPGSRPHHVHASVGGNLVAVGLFGTDQVAVVDTHDDTLLGPWDSNPDTTNGGVHAAVFSKNGQTLYVASDASNEVIALDPRTGSIFWRMTVPAAHELVVTDNDKYAFVSRRTANKLAVIDLEQQTFTDVLTLGLPDTLRLSANQKLLTVGLRTMPAQLAVVDTRTFSHELVNLSPLGGMTTIAGHQWTSPSGRYTFAAFERGCEPWCGRHRSPSRKRGGSRVQLPGKTSRRRPRSSIA